MKLYSVAPIRCSVLFSLLFLLIQSATAQKVSIASVKENAELEYDDLWLEFGNRAVPLTLISGHLHGKVKSVALRKYDYFGKPVKEISYWSVNSYNKGGYLLQSTAWDKDGRLWRIIFTYDAKNLVAKWEARYRGNRGVVTKLTRNKDGNQIAAYTYSTKGKLLFKTKKAYDDSGNIAQEIKYDSTGHEIYRISKEYDKNNRCVKELKCTPNWDRTDSETKLIAYNKNEILITIYGIGPWFEYEDGRVSAPAPITLTERYDSLGRIIYSTDFSIHSYNKYENMYNYDSEGKLNERASGYVGGPISSRDSIAYSRTRQTIKHFSVLDNKDRQYLNAVDEIDYDDLNNVVRELRYECAHGNMKPDYLKEYKIVFY